MKRNEFIKIVVDNAKTKQWLNCTFQIEGLKNSVGIKSYGLWVQLLECNGIKQDSTMGFKTQKELKLWLDSALNHLVCVGS